jgi:AraC-like DNA-binding protein
VIVLTGFAGVDTAVAAMKCGAADYLEKPVWADELALRIRRTVATGVAHVPCPCEAPRTTGPHLGLRGNETTAAGDSLEGARWLLKALLGPSLDLPAFLGVAERFRLLIRNPELMVLPGTGLDPASFGFGVQAENRCPRLWRVLQVLESIRTRPRLVEIARAARVSPADVGRLLWNGTGRTYREWAAAPPIRAALQQVLLTTEHLSVIGYSVGYTQPSNFDRDFTLILGTTPRRCRALWGAGQRDF